MSQATAHSVSDARRVRARFFLVKFPPKLWRGKKFLKRKKKNKEREHG